MSLRGRTPFPRRGGGSRAAEKVQLPTGWGRTMAPARSVQWTLSERVFAAHLRDAGWAGFFCARSWTSPSLMLGVQDRMAILEKRARSPPVLPSQELIHVEACDARDALWAMEEGVRCAALSAVIGRDLGRSQGARSSPRRGASRSHRSGRALGAGWCGSGATANLSEARMRWQIGKCPSLLNLLHAGPGSPAWNVDLFGRGGCEPAVEHGAQAGAASIWLPHPGDRRGRRLPTSA